MFSKLYPFLHIFLVLSFLYPFIFYSFMPHSSLLLVPLFLASCKLNRDSLVLSILALNTSVTWSFPTALGYFSHQWLANIASNLQNPQVLKLSLVSQILVLIVLDFLLSSLNYHNIMYISFLKTSVIWCYIRCYPIQ